MFTFYRRYEYKLREKQTQHQALQEALQDYRYTVTVLPVTLGFSGSHFETTTYALKQLGMRHGPAAILLNSLHELLSQLYTTNVSRRALEILTE